MCRPGPPHPAVGDRGRPGNPSSHVPSGGPNGRQEATCGRPPLRDGPRNGSAGAPPEAEHGRIPGAQKPIPGRTLPPASFPRASAKPPPRPKCPGMAGFVRGKKETAPGNDLPALGDRLHLAATGDRVPPWARRSGRGGNGASGARNRPKGDTGRFGAAGTTPRQGSARANVSGFGRIWPGKKRNGRGSGGSFRAVDGIGSRRRPRVRVLDEAWQATPATTHCRQDAFQPPEIAACAALRRPAAPRRPPGRVWHGTRRGTPYRPNLTTPKPVPRGTPAGVPFRGVIALAHQTPPPTPSPARRRHWAVGREMPPGPSTTALACPGTLRRGHRRCAGTA